MFTYLVALCYILIAHALAFVLLPGAVPWLVRIRVFAFWAISAALLFLLRDPLSVMLLVAAILMLIAPIAPVHRVAFFLVAVTAVPIDATVQLSFPGINNLITLTHYKLISAILLIPALLMGRDRYARKAPFNLPDICIILYIFYTFVIVTIAENPTVGLRFLVDQILILALPYFAIRSVIRSLDDAEVLLQYFLLTSIFLASVALISTLKQWDLYLWLQPLTQFTLADTRSGFLRIAATATTHTLGYHVAAGLIVLEYFKNRYNIGWIQLYALRGLLLIGLLSTDSRGALGGFALAACLYAVLSTKLQSLRLAGLAAGAVAVIGAGIWLIEADFTSLSNNTFSYRQDLLRTGLEYLEKYPLFGDFKFYDSGFFDHLIQGSGIIDVTNLYLQIALHYGAVGLVLFFSVVVLPMLSVFLTLLGQPLDTDKNAAKLSARTGTATNTLAKRIPPAGDPNGYDLGRALALRQASAVMVSVVIGWLFLMATASDPGLAIHLALVFTGMCRAMAELKPEMTGRMAFSGTSTVRLMPPREKTLQAKFR